MDPAFLLLVVFLVYSILLGVCLARMKAINRELDTLKQVMVALGNVQRDERPKAEQLSPEVIDALIRGLGTGNE